jgi:uncharacterized membrane protein YjjP (DUF1212 family)
MTTPFHLMLAYFGVDIRPEYEISVFQVIGFFIVVAIGFVLWDKIVNDKNVPAAIIVGAIMIVVAILSLRGCH